MGKAAHGPALSFCLYQNGFSRAGLARDRANEDRLSLMVQDFGGRDFLLRKQGQGIPRRIALEDRVNGECRLAGHLEVPFSDARPRSRSLVNLSYHGWGFMGRFAEIAFWKSPPSLVLLFVLVFFLIPSRCEGSSEHGGPFTIGGAW